MALSEAQAFGYSTNVQELYVKARKPLEDGHVDVDGVLTDLRGRHAKAAAANAAQEEAKRKARETTDAFVVLKLALVRAVSGALDMAIGAVGKGTIAAENFRKLRSDIDRERAPVEAAETPGGVPPGSPQ